MRSLLPLYIDETPSDLDSDTTPVLVPSVKQLIEKTFNNSGGERKKPVRKINSVDIKVL